jgi:hypothetical protein
MAKMQDLLVGQSGRFMLPMLPVNAFSSSSYAEFQAELPQIIRHKSLVREKQEWDVGFKGALTDWAKTHRLAWRCERNQLNTASDA